MSLPKKDSSNFHFEVYPYQSVFVFQKQKALGSVTNPEVAEETLFPLYLIARFWSRKKPTAHYSMSVFADLQCAPVFASSVVNK